MKLRKLMLLSVAFLATTLTGCNNNPGGNEPKEDPLAVNVFVLSGQSNMQGNTNCGASDMKKAFTDLGLEDWNDVANGIPSVQTSAYCAGYGELDHTKLEKNPKLQTYTNPDNQFAGKFVDTKTGLGNNNKQMGPEFGAAYALKDKATAERPIYFIKMASNGSGFAQDGTKYNWPVKGADGNFPEINLYHTFCKPFVENNLQLIKDAGWHPVIRGWLWHQGESDSSTEKIKVYGQRLGDMVDLFRNDFAEYAKDGNKDNIAFIDGMIYQGSGTQWGAQTSKDMNAAKKAFADSADNNYLVDNYANEEPVVANELKPGSDRMHYDTKSGLRLGMAYGRVIIDNGLLD